MKIIPIIFSAVLFISFSARGQKVTGKLSFKQGQTFEVTLAAQTRVSQQAFGNAIDFTVDGTAMHRYKVTNSTDDNTTLHHDVKRITFNFDGMGSKRSFDSDVKKDLDGSFGGPVKEMLGKKFDMIIDPTGKTLMVKPEKINLSKTDDRLAIVLNMMKDITGVVYPPKKAEASFFKVLPDTAVGINDTWTEAGEDSTGKFMTQYTLSAITDSTIIVGFKGKSSSNTTGEVMGMQTSTTMNNSYIGMIILDKATGIVKEKNITTESNGTTEAMGGSMPTTSKSTITVYVKPVL
ncbi:MAG: hypothetical protein H7Y42_14840 [Chitinophagaceae bacterium]|nr:hypothetical protein [Chitinophagaceae bacterium]